MKIVLICERCERIAPRQYRCLFRQLPYGKELVAATLDCPTVPGERYDLLLRGLMPDSDNKYGVYVSDMIELEVGETLKAAAEAESQGRQS